MSNSSLYAYKHEVFNFLKTVSIKYTPFSYLLGAEYIKEYGIKDIESDPRNPYYQQLCGYYDHVNNPIQVYSIEDKVDVVLTREFLETHPRSKLIYRVPNVEYNTLIARYPEQRGMIQNIVYPAKDVDTVIAARNLSVLTYDSSLLHPGETESLLIAMDKFLNYVHTRWWVPEFAYENLYPIAFWMLLWEALPSVLLAQRVQNIRTNAVHPFHIWEYLISHGLGDYRDIVTAKQALWLYRNMSWIVRNKGKEITLYELAENILTEHRVDLCGIELIQSLEDSTTDCRTDPHFKSIYLPSGKADTTHTTSIMLDRIADTGLTQYYNADEKEQIHYDLAVTQDNLLSTKYIELRRRIISTKYEDILIEFLYSALMYRYSIGDMNYLVDFQDPVYKLSYKFNVGELLYLLYYSIHMSYDTVPELLPKYAACDLAYRRGVIDVDSIDKWFVLTDSKFYTRSYVDIEKTVYSVPIHDDTFISHEEYTTWLKKQFTHYYYELVTIDQGDALYREAMHTVYSKLLVNPGRFIELPEMYPGMTKYSELFIENEVLREVVANYSKDHTARELFNQLAVAIIDLLVPIASYKDTLGINTYNKRIYDGLKKLFVQLCSYNITFLETEKRHYRDLPLPSISEHVDRAIRYMGRLYGVCDIDMNSISTLNMAPITYTSSGVNVLYPICRDSGGGMGISIGPEVNVDLTSIISKTMYIPLDVETKIITL